MRATGPDRFFDNEKAIDHLVRQLEESLIFDQALPKIKGAA
jgi:hypothetical protein